MGLKEMLKQDFSNEKKIVLERYKAAKFALIISSFIFFLNFYFVGANFYGEFFSNILGITYTILLLSLVLYIYFFIKKIFIEKLPNYFFVIVLIFLLILIVFLLLPIIIDGGIVGVLNELGI